MTFSSAARSIRCVDLQHRQVWEARVSLVRLGEVIGDIWVVDASLGRGGMGSVYRCHHKDSDRIEAAIKVLAGPLRDDGDAVARFIREAEILHRLDHPSVVRVRNVRVDSEPPFLEMEYIEGPHLGELLTGGALPLGDSLDYARQLFEALAYLHENEVQHRDLKPENLLVRDGRLILVDFGLALDAGVTRLTVDNMAFGTVAYAPPEWLRPSEIDPCGWDLYAAGVLFWEMLTGEVPFPASGQGAPRQQALQVMLGKQSSPPLDPGEDFPLLLRRLIGDLTRADPEGRPKSANEVLDRLLVVEATIAGGWKPGDAEPEESTMLLGEATQVPPPHRASAVQVSPETRVPLMSYVLAVLGVVGMVSASVTFLGGGEEQEPSLADVTGQKEGIPVVLAIPQLHYPDRLAIALDGRLPDSVTAGEARFSDITPGPQTVEWAYGDGCSLNSCPGLDCSEWCGANSVVIEVPDEGPARLPLPIDVPRRQVSVLMKSVQDGRKGLFKKDPPKFWGWLAGMKGRPDGEMVRFDDISPGEHSLIVAFGVCPKEAAGCTRTDTCPSGCSSERRTVKVSWEEGPLVLISDLRLPQ